MNKKILGIYLVFVVLFFTNTPDKIFKIIKYNYDQRMENSYGFCDKQGYGFLKFVFNNYNIGNKYFFYNYNLVPDPNISIKNLNGVFWNKNKHKGINQEYRIILNYNIEKMSYFLKIDQNKYLLNMPAIYLKAPKELSFFFNKDYKVFKEKNHFNEISNSKIKYISQKDKDFLDIRFFTDDVGVKLELINTNLNLNKIDKISYNLGLVDFDNYIVLEQNKDCFLLKRK